MFYAIWDRFCKIHSTFHGALKSRGFDCLIWKENQPCYYQLRRGEKLETSSHRQCQQLPDEQMFNFHTDVFVTHGFKETFKANQNLKYSNENFIKICWHKIHIRLKIFSTETEGTKGKFCSFPPSNSAQAGKAALGRVPLLLQFCLVINSEDKPAPTQPRNKDTVVTFTQSRKAHQSSGWSGGKAVDHLEETLALADNRALERLKTNGPKQSQAVPSLIRTIYPWEIQLWKLPCWFVPLISLY